MTGLTPPQGVVARPRPMANADIEWTIPTAAGHLTVRASAGLVEELVGPLSVLAFTDAAALRSFAWARLRAELAMAKILEAGLPDEPEPEPDPQLTIDDALAEVGT